MFLCPTFFSLPLVPVADQCPRLEAGGTRLSQTQLIETQYTLLLHTLVDAYLDDYLGRTADGVNEVMMLPAEQAVDNPGSYVWYAACKLYISSTPNVCDGGRCNVG